jgi:hypothetical protein
MKFIKYLTLVAIVAAYANLATAALDDSDITDVDVTTAADANAAAADIATTNFAAVNKSINESLAAINAPTPTDTTKPAMETKQAPEAGEQIWICKPAKKGQANGNGNGSKRNGNGSKVTIQVEPTESKVINLDTEVSEDESASNDSF